jgi:hypothetical protein
VPRFPSENAHAPHPQLWFDCGAGDDTVDTDHDGDDEQEEHDHSESPSPSRSHSRSRPHSPCAPSPTTPQQQPQPTPPQPSPCATHVHFHSRVPITSGLRHPHANRTTRSMTLPPLIPLFVHPCAALPLLRHRPVRAID